MNQLIKKDFWKPEKNINPVDTKNTSKHRKIIKAKEAVISTSNKEIPATKILSETPMIKPLKSGNYVDGVEVVCRCGEKVVIHFDYEGSKNN